MINCLVSKWKSSTSEKRIESLLFIYWYCLLSEAMKFCRVSITGSQRSVQHCVTAWITTLLHHSLHYNTVIYYSLCITASITTQLHTTHFASQLSLLLSCVPSIRIHISFLYWFQASIIAFLFISIFSLFFPFHSPCFCLLVLFALVLFFFLFCLSSFPPLYIHIKKSVLLYFFLSFLSSVSYSLIS